MNTAAESVDRRVAATTVEPITIPIDPEWKYARRYVCGHVQHACCLEHLDDYCPSCWTQ